MKKLLLVTTAVFTLTVVHIQTNAQAPNYLWAHRAGGTSDDYGNSCSADANGNVFVTGQFYSSSITFGTTTLTNAGAGDIFIVKYDPSGNVLWAKSAGGITDDYGYSCSADANGNVFVTGWFFSSSITFGTTTLNTAGCADMFIVKYDSNGNVLWAKSAGGTNNDLGYGCSVDPNGNVFVTGCFFSSSITFGITTLNNIGIANIFIVKYDNSGNVLWANSAGGGNADYAYSCSADATGNVFITGYFEGYIYFGATVLNSASGGGYPDMYIVKYDTFGNVLWANSAGGTTNDYGYSCSADANGNISVTGYFFSPSITFGTTVLNNASADTSDMFIVKYDSVGNVLWAKTAGGTNDDMGYSCSADSNGNMFVTGIFRSSSITFGTTTLNNTGIANIFIVKYDNSGNVLWAKSAGGGNADYGISCSADANGNVFVTGWFWSSSITFGTTTLNNAGTGDMFITKLDIATGIEENNSTDAITVFPNPFSSSTTLRSDNYLHNATLTVDNCFGQTVAQIKNISGQTVVLNRDNLASGLYFVRLIQDNKVIAADKLVITDDNFTGQ